MKMRKWVSCIIFILPFFLSADNIQTGLSDKTAALNNKTAEFNHKMVEINNERPFLCEATAYCATGNPCADGSWPMVGLTVAGKKVWIGKTVLIYEDAGGYPGSLIMIGEIRDTGGHWKIKQGKCIDIFMESREAALEWGRRKVYIELVDAEG